jgi:hypothetical protein
MVGYTVGVNSVESDKQQYMCICCYISILILNCVAMHLLRILQ